MQVSINDHYEEMLSEYDSMNQAYDIFYAFTQEQHLWNSMSQLLHIYLVFRLSH